MSFTTRIEKEGDLSYLDYDMQPLPMAPGQLASEHSINYQYNQKNAQVKESSIGSSRNDVPYNLILKIKYQTKLGQSLCAVGSIQELGSWKEYIHQMKWTEGHIWVSIAPLQTYDHYFQYKYVLIETGKPPLWEKCVNRIADLRILKTTQSDYINTDKFQDSIIQKSRILELNDEWEKFELKLSILIPQNSSFPSDDVQVICSQPGFSIQLEQKSVSNWMFDKYGMKNLKPWVGSIMLDNNKADRCGQWKEDANLFIYQYQHQFQKERHPSRSLQIQNPENYVGQLANNSNQLNPVNKDYQKSDQVFIVNGCINKVDGNFMRDFHLNQIETQKGKKIMYGSYTENVSEIKRLSKEGCTAVLNLMSEKEMKNRNINYLQIMKIYQQNGIKTAFTIPINELNNQEFQKQIFEASKIINDLIESKNHCLYVQCMTGMTRSPTLILTYMLFFTYQPQQSSVQTLIDNLHLTKFQDKFPNIQAIQECFNNNQAFYVFQQKNLQDLYSYNQKIKEEEERLQKLELQQQKDLETQQLYKEQERKRQEEHEKKMQEELRQIRIQEELQKEIQAQQQLLREHQEREKQDLEQQKLFIQRTEQEQRFQDLNMSDQELIQGQIEVNYFQQEPLKQVKVSQAKQLQQIELKKAEDETQILLQKLKILEEEEAFRQLQKEKQIQSTQKQKKSPQQILNSGLKKSSSKRQSQNTNNKKNGIYSEDERWNNKEEQEKFGNIYSAKRNNLQQKEETVDILTISAKEFNSNHVQQEIECAFGDIDLLGLSEAELDQQCDDIFQDVPIKFKPRKGDALDLAIQDQINLLSLNIPIQHIKGQLYLIGCYRMTCELKRNIVMLRTGGGFERFDDFVPGNYRQMQRQLVVQMIKSGNNLEDVVQHIIDGKKIPNLNQEGKKQSQPAQKPVNYVSISKINQRNSPQKVKGIAKRVAINLKDFQSMDRQSLGSANTSPVRISFKDMIQPSSSQPQSAQLRVASSSNEKRQTHLNPNISSKVMQASLLNQSINKASFNPSDYSYQNTDSIYYKNNQQLQNEQFIQKSDKEFNELQKLLYQNKSNSPVRNVFQKSIEQNKNEILNRLRKTFDDRLVSDNYSPSQRLNQQVNQQIFSHVSPTRSPGSGIAVGQKYIKLQNSGGNRRIIQPYQKYN